MLFRGFEGQFTINEIVTLPGQANVSWHFRQFFELHRFIFQVYVARFGQSIHVSRQEFLGESENHGYRSNAPFSEK